MNNYSRSKARFYCGVGSTLKARSFKQYSSFRRTVPVPSKHNYRITSYFIIF